MTKDAAAQGNGDKERTQRDYTYLKVIALIAGIGQIFVLAFAGFFPTFVDKITAAALLTGVGLAAFMAGGFAGFLFGIPRRLQDAAGVASPATGAASDRPLYAGNTNLEQISDWLTKIIVGIGLVEFRNISNFVVDIGGTVSISLGLPIENVAFPISIIIFYFICGFMIGYLWARLYLGRDLDEAERAELVKELDRLTQQNQADASAISFVRQQLSDDASQRPTQDNLNQRVSPASREIKAYIFYLAQNTRNQNWRENKGVMARTIPVFRSLISSDEREQEFHRNYAQLAYALKDQRTPAWEEAEKNLAFAIERRGEATEFGWHAYEANRAICRINLDQNFAGSKPSEPETKERIRLDLRVGSQDPWVADWLEKAPAVVAWLQLNHMKWKDVAAPQLSI